MPFSRVAAAPAGEAWLRWLVSREIPTRFYSPNVARPGPHKRCFGGSALAEGFSMAKGKRKLEVIHLVCEETGDRNYTLRRKSGGEKLKVKKYSPRLRKHTLHNEKKK
jgi:large subunit ribosomal protein L33